MADGYGTMMDPSIEVLLEKVCSDDEVDSERKVGSKFRLVTLSAMRSREITDYLGRLSRGTGASVPPQVVSEAKKPLSIAFEEIAAQKIEAVDISPDAEAEDVSEPVGA